MIPSSLNTSGNGTKTVPSFADSKPTPVGEPNFGQRSVTIAYLVTFPWKLHCDRQTQTNHQVDGSRFVKCYPFNQRLSIIPTSPHQTLWQPWAYCSYLDDRKANREFIRKARPPLHYPLDDAADGVDGRAKTICSCHVSKALRSSEKLAGLQ